MTTQDENARGLGFQGSPNFRDAGGYATRDGGQLHWGRLFRSGHLAGLTPEDRRSLAALDLDLVIDLRRADERRREPSPALPGVDVIAAEITPGSQASTLYADATRLGGAGAMFEFMCDINREFVRSQTEVFRGVFGALLDSRAERILIHCSAGKDRTGFAVAMLHLALGVDLADVEADYLLSGRYFLPETHLERVRGKYAVDHLGDEDLRPMLQTERAYLQAALETVDRLWRDHRTYLAKGLGLGPGEIRELRRRFVNA